MNLKFDLTQQGALYNCPTKNISASCDQDLTSENLNSVLPNNLTNIKNEIGRINTGSQITIMCLTYALCCMFDSSVNDSGIWRIVTKLPFITV